MPRCGSMSAMAATRMPSTLWMVCARPEPIWPQPTMPTRMGSPSAERFLSFETSSMPGSYPSTGPADRRRARATKSSLRSW